jgi:hypothetical protein
VLVSVFVLRLFANDSGLGPDAARFLELTTGSAFYEHMLDVCRRSGVCLVHPDCLSELHRVKVLTLQDVLAKKGFYPSDFERVFEAEFPTVHRAIRSIIGSHRSMDGMDKPHGALVRALQRFESWLVLEVVCPMLVDRIPIVPLHDAVFGRIKDMPLIEGAFHEAFDRLGIRLGLKPDIPGLRAMSS